MKPIDCEIEPHEQECEYCVCFQGTVGIMEVYFECKLDTRRTGDEACTLTDWQNCPLNDEVKK